MAGAAVGKVHAAQLLAFCNSEVERLQKAAQPAPGTYYQGEGVRM